MCVCWGGLHEEKTNKDDENIDIQERERDGKTGPRGCRPGTKAHADSYIYIYVCIIIYIKLKQ